MKLSLLIALSFLTMSVFAQNYQSAESVEYDASQNRWLVSNGNNILQRTSDGTLSFFGNGTGSHGMEVMGDYVFACSDGNKINGYELSTANEVMSLTITGAGFLNGLTNDGNGILYATDFSNKRIIKIDVSDIANPTFETLINNTGATPNGIIYDGDNNRLLWVEWNSNAAINAVNLADNSMSEVQTTSLGNIDGIDEDNDQNYYISSWGPARISKLDKDFMNPIETITTPFLSNPADIGYSKVTDTLAIPMGNNVIYVDLGEEDPNAVNELVLGDFGMIIFPNPVSQSSYIQFELEKRQTATLTVYTMQGQVIARLMNGEQASGMHKVVLAGMNWTSGNYFARLETEEGEQTMQLFVE